MKSSKRFTNIHKWEDKSYRDLSLEEKVYWEFINSHCTAIGLYSIDLELASFSTKIEESKIPNLGVYNTSSTKIVQFNHHPEHIVFIKNFIREQYSGKKSIGLNLTSPPHYGYLNEIRQHGLWNYILSEDPLLISNKSLVYYFNVDAGTVENDKKPTRQEIESLPLKFSDIPDDYLHPRVQGEWYSYGQPDYSVQNLDFSELSKTEDEDVLAILQSRDISYSLVRNIIPLLNPYMNEYEINRHDFEKDIFELLILLNSKEKDLFPAEFLLEIAKSVSDRCGKEMTNLSLVIREFNDCYALNLPLKSNT